MDCARQTAHPRNEHCWQNLKYLYCDQCHIELVEKEEVVEEEEEEGRVESFEEVEIVEEAE